MRAGRANCMSNIQQDMIEQTLAILASMMQQAAHDATLYCAEAKRTVIMPRDIELALKRLVLPGSAYWTRDDLSEEAQQIREHLFTVDSSGREWKGEKWWIALPIATRTIDRYPLGPRGQRTGTSPGVAYTRAWAGVRGG